MGFYLPIYHSALREMSYIFNPLLPLEHFVHYKALRSFKEILKSLELLDYFDIFDAVESLEPLEQFEPFEPFEPSICALLWEGKATYSIQRRCSLLNLLIWAIQTISALWALLWLGEKAFFSLVFAPI